MRDNPKLKTDLSKQLPALSGRKQCSIKVNSCGEQYKNGVSCHRFYKCIDGKAYSCQNPKVFQSMCSGKYWGKGGTDKYLCTGYTDVKTRDDAKKRYGLETREGAQKYNDDMCKA